MPDEETDEVCELCGRKMVIKMGRFGRFMACPGYPECKNTKPIVERMPGRCPKCGSGMLKRKSKKGYAYYACEKGAECGFMTWDVPVKDDCPVCGHTMFKKAGRGFKKPFCINEACPAFVPEEKRGGYRKKKTEEAKAEDQAAPAQETAPAEEAAEKAPAKKRTAKKAAGEKKTAGKKPAAKKTAKAGEAKPAAKKTAAKKTKKAPGETPGEPEETP